MYLASVTVLKSAMLNSNLRAASFMRKRNLLDHKNCIYNIVVFLNFSTDEDIDLNEYIGLSRELEGRIYKGMIVGVFGAGSTCSSSGRRCSQSPHASASKGACSHQSPTCNNTPARRLTSSTTASLSYRSRTTFDTFNFFLL